jgi:hypothetical protein
MITKTYQGSCHCGRVKYQAEVDLNRGTSKCNCTFCLKARAWKAFVKPESFRLLSGGDSLTGYRTKPEAPWKYHCAVCGVRTHEAGSSDFAGGDFVGVFITTLDDITPEELVDAPVKYLDGRHDDWQHAPSETRYL